jgi:hypothetical protein
MRVRFFVKRLIKYLFVILAVLFILFEELLWNHIERFMEWLSRFRIVSRIEEVIIRQNRVVAMALFLVPMAILVPFKLFAAYLIATGMVGTGVLVILTAKVVGTFFVTRLFVLNKEKLLTFKYFAAIYLWVLAKKAWAHDELNSIPAWIKIKEMVRHIKALIVSMKNNGGSYQWLALLKKYVVRLRKQFQNNR